MPLARARSRIRPVALPVALGVLLAVPLAAQPTLASLSSGIRIHVDGAAGALRGRLVGVAHDTLLVQTGDVSGRGLPLEQRATPLACVRRMRAVVGRASARRGMVVGGSVGALFGAVAGAAAAEARARLAGPVGPDQGGWDMNLHPGGIFPASARAVARDAALGVTAGTAVGALLGRWFRPERWEPVALPSAAAAPPPARCAWSDG